MRREEKRCEEKGREREEESRSEKRRKDRSGDKQKRRVKQSRIDDKRRQSRYHEEKWREELNIDPPSQVSSSGKSVTRVKSFKDPNFSDGVFLLSLISALNPNLISWQLVTSGDTAGKKRGEEKRKKREEEVKTRQEKEKRSRREAKEKRSKNEQWEGRKRLKLIAFSLENKALNAKLAISAARQMGCCIFCLWEVRGRVRQK